MNDASTMQSTAADTLPKLLMQAASGPHAQDTALRQKKLGVWTPYTWEQYAASVRDTYLGLKALGLGDGDRVFYVAENVPEVFFLDLAVQAFRGLLAGAFPDSQGEEITHLWNHAQARFAIVGDQEQADKLLALDLPRLEYLIVIDNRCMSGYTDPRIITFQALMALGKKSGDSGNSSFLSAVASGKPSDPVALMYTSGTTGNPKGVILTQAAAVYAGKTMVKVENLSPEDEAISYLPYAWVGERVFSMFYALAARYKVNFPEDHDMDVVLANWREVRPSIPVAPARIWEGLCSRVYIGIDNTTPFKRWVFHALMAIGNRVANDRLAARQSPWWVKACLPVADLIMFRPIRTELGLSQARSAYTGGSALGPEVFTFFHSIGVNLRQIYGQTESCGVAVLHQGDRIHLDTVGEPFPGMEIRISDRGEVLMRGPLVFSGYLDNPEATAAGMDDGWLRTGDQGSMRDGQLLIVDRMKEVCRTRAGEEFSPQLLQNKLKFSRFIREAVVVGHELPYTAALIQIDYDNVGNWATQRGINFTTFRDLCLQPEVRTLITEEIAATNHGIPPGLRIQEFHLLEKELDADDGEITRTAKIKRSNVERKYAELIASLYRTDRVIKQTETQ
ncbi:MAG: AMP-binding protein [Pseudomonadota bacterium]